VPPADSLRALAAKIGLRIGTAATPADLSTANLSTITSDQFSVLTPENEMKWQVVEPEQGVFNWTGADNLVNYAEAHGERVRGHTLMWHNQLPNWLTTGVANGTISDAQLLDLLHQHITTEVGRYRGKIWQWDVANEMLTDSNPSMANPNDFWISHVGLIGVADAFRWAHEADPHALLCYNDYNIAGEDGSNAKFTAAYNMIKAFLAEGVPISCVGDQGHLDLQYGFPTLMTQDLQAYASLGLKVAITEADVRTFVNNATQQVPTNPLASTAGAEWYDGMLKACLAVKSCISFTVWGFDDAESWVPGVFTGEGSADLYDVNLNPKPAYTALQQTLQLAAGARRHSSDD
jgi:endo-1,4-beta-xylanase